eukprot:TRINITY_DN6886_c0_g1_i1.p1 TRINITY_DN6886_c0_g1~~TRINITY_DN6886_c0_g1_i1.p1  ORF type:complete len:428 (-),score=56.21 TRINITY_DN6886_c0_g1_i1:49-1332(-)
MKRCSDCNGTGYYELVEAEDCIMGPYIDEYASTRCMTCNGDGDVLPVKCWDCGRRFKNKSALHKHKHQSHPKIKKVIKYVDKNIVLQEQVINLRREKGSLHKEINKGKQDLQSLKDSIIDYENKLGEYKSIIAKNMEIIELQKLEYKERDSDLIDKKNELDIREQQLVLKVVEINELMSKLEDKELDLSKRESKVQEHKEFIDEIYPIINDEIVTAKHLPLNVGGYKCVTSLTTIMSQSDTMLASMFSGRFNVPKDSEGNYFIDRDGTIFELVLLYLRLGELPNGMDRQTLLLFCEELDYYNIELDPIYVVEVNIMFAKFSMEDIESSKNRRVTNYQYRSRKSDEPDYKDMLCNLEIKLGEIRHLQRCIREQRLISVTGGSEMKNTKLAQMCSILDTINMLDMIETSRMIKEYFMFKELDNITKILI